VRHYFLNEEEIDLINHVRLLTQTQKIAIICAVHELTANRNLRQFSSTPSNVIPLPTRT